MKYFQVYFDGNEIIVTFVKSLLHKHGNDNN